MCEYVKSLNENAEIVKLLRTHFHVIISQAVHGQAKKKRGRSQGGSKRKIEKRERERENAYNLCSHGSKKEGLNERKRM